MLLRNVLAVCSSNLQSQLKFSRWSCQLPLEFWSFCHDCGKEEEIACLVVDCLSTDCEKLGTGLVNIARL